MNKNLISEYINIMNVVRVLNDIFDSAAYKWIQNNIGIADLNKSSESQLGKAVIEFNPGDIHRGFDWKFDNYKNPQFIIITYSNIHTIYGGIKEDNEVTLSFSEFEKYF